MGSRMAQHKTTGLGQHHGIGITQAAAAQIQRLGMEGHMAVLGHIIGVEYEPVVTVTALVKDLAVHHIQRAEVGAYLTELYAPTRIGLAGAEHLVIRQVGEFLYQTRATDKDLAAGPAVAGEGTATHIDQCDTVHGAGGVVELLVGLAPYASGKVYGLFLDGIV